MPAFAVPVTPDLSSLATTAQLALKADASAVPQPASNAPPAVASTSDKGNTAGQYAMANHTHQSSVQARRVQLALTNGKATWTFPNAFASGVVPVVEVTAETPDGAAYRYSAGIVESSITNTGCSIYVVRTAQNTTLPGLATSLLGLLIPFFTQATGSVWVNCLVRPPS